MALRRHVGSGRGVEVTLDAATPILLEGFAGFEREFRVELQNDSVRQAADLEIPVRRERVEVAEIATRIAADEVALLLIDQTPMHANNEAHWITAHASDGHSVVLVQDPWIDRPAGETWVDAHDLAIRLGDLDRMCSWEEEDHRGVVFLSRGSVLFSSRLSSMASSTRVVGNAHFLDAVDQVGVQASRWGIERDVLDGGEQLGEQESE